MLLLLSNNNSFSGPLIIGSFKKRPPGLPGSGSELTGPKFGHGMRDYLHVCREFRKSWGLAAKAETPLKFGGVSYLEANYKQKIDVGCQINTQTIG